MNSRLLDRTDLETEEEESVEPPLGPKKGEFLMIMIINISVWMEAVWERRQQMIHQPLSNTFFFSPSKSLFFTCPFSFNQHNNNRQIFGLVGGRTRWLKVFNGAKDNFWSKGFISLQSDSWVSSKKQPRSQMLFIQPWIRFRMFWGYEDCCSLLRHRWKIKSDNNEMRLMKDWVTQEDSALVFPLNSIGFFFF